MKPLQLLPVLFLAATPLTSAELAQVLLVYDDDAEKAYLTAASTTNVEYTANENSLNRTRKPRSEINAIYFFEPLAFKDAMHLYENRDYKGAKEAFAACKAAYKAIDDLPGNYSTLAGFYELECCRKLEDLEGLKSLLDLYQSGPLTRESDKNQEQVYVLWDAVRTKSWPRLDTLAKEYMAKKNWTGTHLAQIYYCHGLALEGLGRPTDALNAFNGAMTADYTASEVITKKAALSALRILKDHEEVKLAMELWGTDDEDPNASGYLLLQEGVALCDLWKKALGGGEPLPTEYAVFLKHRSTDAATKKKPAANKEEETPKDADKKDDKADEKKPAPTKGDEKPAPEKKDK